MKINSAILPLVPFPNLYWFSIYGKSESVVVDVFENYIKQSARNRYEILNAHGRQVLGIPVVGQKGIKTPVKEIQVADQNWQIIHWRSIVAAYNSSPFFIYYRDELEELFERHWNTLEEFSKATVDFVFEALQEDVKHVYSEEYVNSGDNDFRGQFKPVHSGFTHSSYKQVFSDRLPFEFNLSVLDLIFNKGPEASLFLEELIS